MKIATEPYYLCPLPQVQLAEGELDEALKSVWSAEQALTAVFRESEPGKPKLIAQGYEREVPMRVEVEGKWQAWTERRLVVRSVRHAQAAEAALRSRVAKARLKSRPSTGVAEGANALKMSRPYVRR